MQIPRLDVICNDRSLSVGCRLFDEHKGVRSTRLDVKCCSFRIVSAIIKYRHVDRKEIVAINCSRLKQNNIEGPNYYKKNLKNYAWREIASLITVLIFNLYCRLICLTIKSNINSEPFVFI